jgi:hypothetical protein
MGLSILLVPQEALEETQAEAQARQESRTRLMPTAAHHSCIARVTLRLEAARGLPALQLEAQDKLVLEEAQAP